MTFLQHALEAIPLAATSPYALAAYLVTIVAWVAIAFRVARNRELLRHIESLPQKDRLAAIQTELGGGVHVPGGISPEDWLRGRTMRYYFVGYMTLVLALSVIVVIAMLRPGFRPAMPGERDIARARQFLEWIYQDRLNDGWNLLPESLTTGMSFSTFSDQVKTQLYQYSGEPLVRKHIATRVTSDFAELVFEAEWDAVSVLREVVTLKREGPKWNLWAFTIGPKEWPSITAPKYLTAKSLKEYLAEQSAKPPSGQSSAVGRYIPPPGWVVRLADAGERRQGRTCDRAAIEAASSLPLLLKGVAGGCALEPGDRVILFGKVDEPVDGSVTIRDVRVLPADD
jgi:hypothetical protein